MRKLFLHSSNHIFQCSLEAIELLHWSVSASSMANGTIQASTKMSIWSWGEEVEIRISKIGSQVGVDVNSRAKAQLFAWGANDENEKKFIIQLSNLLEQA